ncbi:MAG: hypothetical protein AB7E85_01880 [Pseudobdellovibrionaceae bacterium]
MASVFPDYLSTAALSWACIQDYAAQRLNGQNDPFYALSLLFVADCLEAQMTQQSLSPRSLTECAWARSQEGDYIEPIFSQGDYSCWIDVNLADVSDYQRSMYVMNSPAVIRTIAAANEMSVMQWKQMVHALPVCLEAMKNVCVGIDPVLELQKQRYLIALPNEVVACPDFKKNRHARPIAANEDHGTVIEVNFGLR